LTAQIIGCIHLLPLPGSPGYAFNKEEIINKTLCELEIYKEAGVEGLIVENTSDICYLKGTVYSEMVCMVFIICHEIRKRCNLYQVLAAPIAKRFR
jgi:uncharacterized protein